MANVLYEVEQIVGKKIIFNPRRVSYLVRWKGFSSDHDSWEPVGNLDSCKKLIKFYNSNPDNPVIKEDGHASTQKALKTNSQTNSHVKLIAKGDKRLSSNNKLGDKDKVNNDSALSKATSSDISNTQEKGQKSCKENLTTFSSSKLTQVDFPEVPSKVPISINGRISDKRSESSDKTLRVSKEAKRQSISLPKVVKKMKTKILSNFKTSSPILNSSKKIIRKRRHPDVDIVTDSTHASDKLTQNGPSFSKKLKLSQVKAPQNSSQDKTTIASQDVVDLTNNDGGCSEDLVHEKIEISDEEDEDDENVLYSLNSDCDHLSNDANSTNSDCDHLSNDANSTKDKKIKEGLKPKSNDNSKASVISKLDYKAGSVNDSSKKSGGKKKNRMSLMDSKKSPKTWQNESDTVRTVTPPLLYTSVKDIDDPSNPDPSKPSGNSMPDPVSPEASETYLADVPSSFPVPAEEPITDEPLSPGSLLYKSLVDSLPGQFRAAHKGNSKKGKGVNSRGDGNHLPGKSLFGSSAGKGPVERRTSVRSTECAFRYKQIVVKKCPRYTQIWLNTTTVMKNALNPLVMQEIMSALNSAKYDDSHLVLFSGLGNVFCSGIDLHYLVSGDRPVAARQMAEKIRELTKTFITFPKPIIAAVSGACVGLGVALLALCDVVYASDKASFHMPYSQLSQTPEGCSSFTLPLTVGLPSANELLYGGRKITAMEAYQVGLVSQVFWPTLMMQEIIPRVQNMAACSSKALEATKLLVRSHHRTKMELTNETECNLLLESWFSVECQQAIEAYIGNEKNLTF